MFDRGTTRSSFWLLLLAALLLCHGSPARAAGESGRAGAAHQMFAAGPVESLEAGASDLLERLGPILDAAPNFGADLGKFADELAKPAQAGPWIVQSLIAVALALVAVLLIPARVERLCRRLSRSDRQGALMVGTLIGDLCGIVALVALFGIGKTLWFADDTARSAATVSLLSGFVQWRVMMLPVDVLLRHRHPGARLVDAGDVHAAEMQRLAAWLLGFVALSRAVLRAFLRTSMPLPTVQFLALGVGLINAALAFYLLGRLHHTLQATPSAVAMESAATSRPGRLWYPLALVYVLALTLAWIWGVIRMDLALSWALVGTGGIALGALTLHSILRVLLARTGGTGAEPADTSRTARWHRLIRHCFAVLLWVAVAVLIVEVWIEPLSHVLPMTEWDAFRGPIISAAVTIYVAYVLWRIVSIHTETLPLPGPGQMLSDENGGVPPIASRLQTMLPVLRIFVLVAIATVAVLIALSDLGVNTTSLIAGASIFGLAISFGSQSLVHDIVSGIFFMADDAFRIGEYIDTSKAKGTVESMSVRSLRLRHQNGQIHVIPFGQIQQVTNFSRDWTTVKFNLRLQINTDIEKVRKTVKQIGAEMMKEPEFAADLLQPLKMQGVTEIDPLGLVVRLKFTAKPIQPTLLQREALKRITQRFREKGIEFASSNLMLQTVTVPATAEDVPKPALQAEAAPGPAPAPQPNEIRRPTRNAAGA